MEKKKPKKNDRAKLGAPPEKKNIRQKLGDKDEDDGDKKLVRKK